MWDIFFIFILYVYISSMGDTTHMWVPEKGGPVSAREAEGVARDVGHPQCLDFVEERARRGIARVTLDHHLSRFAKVNSPTNSSTYSLY